LNEYLTDEIFKKNCYLPEFKMSQAIQENLHLYSQIHFPVRRRHMQAQGLYRLRKVKGWTPILDVGQNKCVVDLYLVYLTLLMHQQLTHHWPQYGSVNGDQNVWICKPCYNSRGFGIFCFNQKQEIISTFSKKAPAPKVV